MKLDNMDYLRQQIEASLGRSEELILLDKAKCGVFYRYPGEPPPSASKKRSKDRGTFNSVRLKKYLGLGSKRKQKDNEDDNSQPHQIYLGDLQRYGSYYDANQFPMYQAEYHRRPALSYEGGSVSVGRSLHYPNMYASVSVRSPHSRGTVYGVYPWSDHYLQTSSGPALISNMNVLTEIAPLAIDRQEAFDSPCTCEESEVKSKRHRHTCTCSPGTRSKWWTKRLSRPSLFHVGGGEACDHEDQVNQIQGIKKREGQVTAKANEYERTPLAKSRLHRLSDLSTSSNGSNETNHKVFSKAATEFRETVHTRKSILECPVNPYELINSNRDTPKQQTVTKKNTIHDYEDIDERFNGLLKKDVRKNATVKVPSKSNSKARKSVPNSFRSISSGSRYRMDDDTENDAPAISLGGQRIRLFGTVNGVGSTNKAIKRPSLPSFTELSTLDNKKSTHNKNISEENSNVTNKNSEITNKSFDSPSKTTTKVSPSRSSDDWLIEREEDFINHNKPSKTFSHNDLSSLSPQSGKSRKMVQHKTKIAIGGERTKSETVPQNYSLDIENKNKTSCEPTYVNVGIESGKAGSCYSIIPVNEDSPSNSNKLNLRINFNELSAYLKPILKKSSYIESSPTSSEAEGSETYSSTPSVNNSDENVKQKQKKHVHFLSSRQLSSSSEFNSQSGDESEEETSNSRNELSSNIRANNNVVEEDSDRETGSSESESFRNGTSESEDELLSSSSSSTQDLYDDGVSIIKQNSSGMVDERCCVRWSPESHSSGHSNCSENGNLKNVKFATLNDDMAVIGMSKSNSADVKKFNLRRSLSERQVAVDNLPSCNLDENVDRSSKLSPVRSHSFQTVASMKSNKNVTDQRSIPREVSFNEVSFSNHSIPGKSGIQSKGSCTGDSSPIPSTFVINSGRKSYSKSSPTAIRKKYANEDISHQPVYQNSHNAAQSQMVATIIAKCTNNNNNFRVGSTESKDQENTSSRKLSSQFTKNSITPTSSENDLESSFCKHFDSLERASRSADRNATENNNKSFNRNKSSSCLGIAQKKAIPKFLPRPSYTGKHVPVCSLYDVSDTNLAMKEEVDNALSWSSEDDLYTDGTSHLYNQNNDNCKRFNAITSLPPIPIDCRRQSPASKSEDSDDNGIYEQIGEPLYEEVPDTISYSSGTSAGTGSMGHPRKSIFEGASKTEILSYLEDAKERGVENISSTEDAELVQEEDDGEIVNETSDEHENQKTLSSKRNHRNRISNLSNLSDSSQTSDESFQNEEAKDKDTRYGHCNVEVERNDSGVGSETSKPSRLRRQSRLEESAEQICVDCDLAIDKVWENESESCYVEPLVCKKCSKKRCERKEIILEFVETEIKYGRDLRIIKEEFQRPMLVAGLLSEELLSNIFLNLDQLIEVNDKFTEKLKDALDIAGEHGDEDYNTVNVGKMFLDSSSMLPAFETYCVRQGTASMLLTNLEKEKELLRIFLKVSQMENTLLRRLNLNSFLMVPVQRVTKYPLLINRLYKVTPHHHQDREALREAQLKIELHLEHINQQAKDFSGMNLWRRISNMSNPQRRNLLEPVIGNIKMRKMALEILQWNSDEVRFAMEGRLHYTQINENLWNKREKSIKLATIHGLLITLGNPNSDYRPDLADRDLIFPRNTGIREATLVLIKEKNNRFNLVREPLPLQRCVISCDPEVEEMFEVQEFTSKDAYLIKGDDIKDTQEWLKMLRYHAKDLGAWRRRRNALANIMINGMAAKREWL